MRVPSIKKLTERLNLTREQAKLVRALGRAVDDPEDSPASSRSTSPRRQGTCEACTALPTTRTCGA